MPAISRRSCEGPPPTAPSSVQYISLERPEPAAFRDRRRCHLVSAGAKVGPREHRVCRVKGMEERSACPQGTVRGGADRVRGFWIQLSSALLTPGGISEAAPVVVVHGACVGLVVQAEGRRVGLEGEELRRGLGGALPLLRPLRLMGAAGEGGEEGLGCLGAWR